MKWMHRFALGGLFLALVALTACQSGNPDGTAVPEPVTLVPYATRTPALTLTPAATLPLDPGLLPTPTPFAYTVAEGDTLIGIAVRFGVELEDLLAANPGLSPQALPVGTQLTIPTGPVETPLEPTPTAVPLQLSEPACYPTANRGLWCFVKFSNPYPDVLENVSALLRLVDADGNEVASQVALPLLNILPPGKTTALAGYFENVQVPVRPAARLLTAIRLLPNDQRYLPAQLEHALVEVAWAGRTAQVSGLVSLPEGVEAAGQVWVAALAYDASGRVVGLRRWEAQTPLQPGEQLPFSLLVASLGAPIEGVELLVEARP